MERQLKSIPFSVIKNALAGDEDALLFIIKHFERYIQALATKHYTDDWGNDYYFVDEYVKLCLQAKLMFCIMTKFRLLQS